MRTLAALALFLATLIPGSLSGCSSGPSEFMRPPVLSEVGSGLVAKTDDANPDSPLHMLGGPIPRAVSLYTDQRIARVGDIVTVVISINDKATFGNSTGRSTAAKTNFGFDWLFNPGSSGTSTNTPTPLTFNSDVN